jgi:hypothetical protein
MRGDRVLLAEVALLRALDLLTTYYNLSTGLHYEANPFQRELMQHPPLFLAVQVFGILLLYLLGLVGEHVLARSAHRGLSRLSKPLTRLIYAALLSLPILNNIGLVDVASALYG